MDASELRQHLALRAKKRTSNVANATKDVSEDVAASTSSVDKDVHHEVAAGRDIHDDILHSRFGSFDSESDFEGLGAHRILEHDDDDDDEVEDDDEGSEHSQANKQSTSAVDMIDDDVIESWRQKIEAKVSRSSFQPMSSIKVSAHRLSDDDGYDSSGFSPRSSDGDDDLHVPSGAAAFTEEQTQLAKLYLSCQDEAGSWVHAVLGLDLDVSPGGLYEMICNGVLLCDMANVLSPNSIPEIKREYSSAMAPLAERENISAFLRCCREKFHVLPSACFTPSELHSRENMPKVLYTLRVLADKIHTILDIEEDQWAWPVSVSDPNYVEEIVQGALYEISALQPEKLAYIHRLHEYNGNGDHSQAPAEGQDGRPSTPHSGGRGDRELGSSPLPRSPDSEYGAATSEKFASKLNDVQHRLIVQRSSMKPPQYDASNSPYYNNDNYAADERFANAHAHYSSSHQLVPSFHDDTRESEVTVWLQTLGLGEYAHVFSNDGWDDMETVAQIENPKEILQSLGITKRGHIMKLLGALKKWKENKERLAAEKNGDGLNGDGDDDDDHLAHDVEWRQRMGLLANPVDAKRMLSDFQMMQHEFQKLNLKDERLWASVGKLSGICEEYVRYLAPFDVPLVIDIGWNSLKVGFAKDKKPRFTVPAVISVPKQQQSSGKGQVLVGDKVYKDMENNKFRYPMRRGIDTISEPVVIHWDDMELLFQSIFKTVLRVLPSKHPLLVCVPPFFLPSHVDKLRDTLFKRVGVEMLFITKSAPLVMHALGLDKGIVLDVGEGFSTAYAVEKLQLMNDSTVNSPIAGGQLTELMMRTLVEDGCDFKSVVTPQHSAGWLSGRAFQEVETARIIKEKACYVSQSNGARTTNIKELVVSQDMLPAHLRPFLPRAAHAPYLNVGRARSLIPEALFQPSIVRQDEFYKGGSLQGIVKESISRCPFSMQQTLWENIVVCGGTSTCPGLVERLELMLKDIAPGDMVPKLVVPDDPLTAIWRGGAMLSSTQNFQRHWVSRSTFLNDEKSNSLHLVKYFDPQNMLAEPTTEELLQKTGDFIHSMDSIAKVLLDLDVHTAPFGDNPPAADGGQAKHVSNSNQLDATAHHQAKATTAAAQVASDRHIAAKSAAATPPASPHDGYSNATSPASPESPAFAHEDIPTQPQHEGSNTGMSKLKSRSPVFREESSQKSANPVAIPSGAEQAPSQPASRPQAEQKLAEPMKDSIDRMNMYMKHNRFPQMLQVDIRVFICDKFATGEFGINNEAMGVVDILAALPAELQNRVKNVDIQYNPELDGEKAVKMLAFQEEDRGEEEDEFSSDSDDDGHSAWGAMAI